MAFLKQLILVLNLGFGFAAHAQIVSIEPVIFTIDDEITITYDATKGSAGLVGVAEVFMHTGIITQAGGPGNWQNVQGNWGQYDPKVLMQNIGNDLHQLVMTPRDFYNINAGTEVTQLAFVFRNEDGSKEGKTATLEDIFVDIPDPNTFSGFFISPENSQLVKEPGETIEVRVVVTQTADDIRLYDNGTLIAQGSGTTLNHIITADQFGNHEVKFEADAGNESITEDFSYVVINSSPTIANPPAGTAYGLNRVDVQTAILSLYAPQKKHVFALGNFNDWKVNVDYQMKLSSDMTTWWIELSGLDDTEWQMYQYLVDGVIKIADPYSELILDETNDGSIPLQLNSVPASFPKGQTAGHVSIFKTQKEAFPWQATSFVAPEVEELVIYEMLMRDFLKDHSFQSLKDTLPYLKRLGINAIEVMPVSEFENNQSWGYNPSYHMALDKYYGSPQAFKELVDEAHKNGMAVLLDIVYNHAFGQSPLVRLYWDSQANKPSSSSPWFNSDAKHPYNVGFDFNHESSATQQYVKQTIAYWISEYQVDGFRFDLSKGFTQRFSTDDGVFASFDQGRVNRLKDYADFIWDIDPDQILILEHFAENVEEKALSDYGFLLWGNANYNFNEATMGYNTGNKSDFGHIFFGNRNWTRPHLVGYMESHDEERLMFKNLTYGNASGSYDVTELTTGLERVKAAASFFFSVPGPKMIWQFGELGYEFSINRCEDGTIDDNCRLAPKPVHWEYAQDAKRAALFDHFSRMLHLKQEHPAIHSGEVTLESRGAAKKLLLSHPDGNICIIGNFDVEQTSIAPAFQHTGEWYNYHTGSPYQVSDVDAIISLAPGESSVFIDDSAYLPDGVSSTLVDESAIYVGPNPTSGELRISIPDGTHLADPSYKLRLFGMDGRLILEREIVLPGSVELTDLPVGFYLLRLEHEAGGSVTEKVVVY